MFILVTDKYGYEKSRHQVENFDQKRSLREVVRYSLTKFLEVPAIFDDDEKISLVLDGKETELLSKIIKRLYGPGYSGKCFRDLLNLILVDEVKKITFGDERLRAVAEDVCWRDSKNEDRGAPGISICRVKERERHWYD